jgi:hypothetical protein
VTALRRVVIVGVLVLSACGTSSSGVSGPASRQLHTQVAAIRFAARGADRAAAAQQVANLLASVRQLRARGDLSASAAADIRRAAAAVTAQLVLIPLPTTTTTTTTTAPPPTRPEPGHRDKNPKGNDGHGRPGNQASE